MTTTTAADEVIKLGNEIIKIGNEIIRLQETAEPLTLDEAKFLDDLSMIIKEKNEQLDKMIERCQE